MVAFGNARLDHRGTVEGPICPGAPPAAAASVSCSSGCRAPPGANQTGRADTLAPPCVPQATLCPFHDTDAKSLRDRPADRSQLFSMAEISLAAARRLRLRQLVDEGDLRAERVLRVQDQPGDYFTVVQIRAERGSHPRGIVGEGSAQPVFQRPDGTVDAQQHGADGGFLASFTLITSLFILFPTCFPSAWAWRSLSGWRSRWCSPYVVHHTAAAGGLALQPGGRCAVPGSGPVVAARRPHHLR